MPKGLTVADTVGITLKKPDTFTGPQQLQITPRLHPTIQIILLIKIHMLNSTPPVLYLPMLNTVNPLFNPHRIMTLWLPDDKKLKNIFEN